MGAGPHQDRRTVTRLISSPATRSNVSFKKPPGTRSHQRSGVPGTGLEAQPSHILQPNLARGRLSVIPLALGLSLAPSSCFFPLLTWLTPFSTRMGGISVKEKQASRLLHLKRLHACPGAQPGSDSSSPLTRAPQDMDPHQPSRQGATLTPTSEPLHLLLSPEAGGLASSRPPLEPALGSGSPGLIRGRPTLCAPEHMLSLIPSWHVAVGKQLVYLVTCLFSVSPTKT